MNPKTPMTINCKGKLINLDNPKVMGVVNLTPDSFYEGSRHSEADAVLFQVEKMLTQGADFIDMGAYSSRPNAVDISVEEELSRLLPILEKVIAKFPETLVSVDTFRSKVAKEAIENGAAIINDISAGKLDETMLQVVAKYQVPYIMMHMKGTPQTMQQLCSYDDLLNDINFYFSERIQVARELGINDVIIDLGFGFAKTLEQNYQLLQNLDLFTQHEVPILTGVSRKSMIYKLLGTSPKEALNGTSVLNTVALLKGTSILRVHDVKEALEAVKLVKALGKE